MKPTFFTAIMITVSTISLTSCGIVGVVDSDCLEIKKSSEEKREIGRTLLDMADAGRVGEGMTVEKVQAEGFKFFIDGTKLVADNPQCFSDQEVKTANSLLGR
jgi:hypothetical protein